ncbi:MAG: hypothetical protein ACJ8FZ_11195 [Bradyrhizobium sp.]
MPDSDRSDKVMNGEVLTGPEPACVDLVPVTAAHLSPGRVATRPDPTFVTHLIATAEQVPQTRSLRRAVLADAQTAYGARPQERRGVARRTRQII